MAMVNLLRATTVPAVFIEATSDSSGSGAHTLTLAAVQAGDLLLTFLSMVAGDTPSVVPSGWTLERLDSNPSAGFGVQNAYVYSRVADAGDVASPSYGWDDSTSSGWTAALLQYRGPTGIVTSGATITSNSTTLAAPSVTAPSEGLLVVAFQIETNAGGPGPPTGMTTRRIVTGASGITAQQLYDEIVPAGATGTRSVIGPDPEYTIGQSLILG